MRSSRGTRTAPLLVGLALVTVLASAALALDPNLISAVGATTWSSCDTVQFKLQSTEALSSVTQCIFQQTSGITNDYIVTSVLHTQTTEVQCVLNDYFDAGDFSLSINTTSGVLNLPNIPITISFGAIAADVSSVNTVNYFFAGDDLYIDVTSLTVCSTVAPCSESSNTFTIQWNGSPVPGSITFSGTNDDGSCHFVASTFTVQGAYPIQVSYMGNPVGTQTLTIRPGPISPAACVTDSSNFNSMVAGVATCFSVTLYDSYGNYIANQYASTFLLEDGNSQLMNYVLSNTDNSHGQYQLCVTPTRAGAQQQLHVLVSTGNTRSDVAGSPFTINVATGAFSPTQSVLYDDNNKCPVLSECYTASTDLGLSQLVAGQTAVFYIMLYDTNGNLRNYSISDMNINNFNVAISGPSSAVGQVTARGNTNYSLKVSYSLQTIGTYVISVTYSSQLVGFFTGSVQVTAAAASSSASTFTASSSYAVRAGVALSPSPTLMLTDQFGNVRVNDNLLSVRAVSTTSGTHPDGRCSLTGSLVTPGLYTASCSFTDASASYSFAFYYNSAVFTTTVPITVTPALVSSKNSSFAAVPTSIVAGTNSTIVITAYDVYGNPSSTLDSLTFRTLINPTSGGQIFSSTVTTFTSPNTYRAPYQLTKTGSYQVSINFANTDIPAAGNSHITVLPGSTVASNSLVTLPTTVTAGVQAVFKVTARDLYLNARTGVDESSLFFFNFQNVQQSSVVYAGSVKPSLTGVYNITFTPTVSGAYVVKGAYSNPNAVIITTVFDIFPNVPSTPTTTFATTSTAQSTCTAGQVCVLQIFTVDVYRNPVGFSPNYTVAINTASGTFVRFARDVTTANDGLASLSSFSYNLTVAGSYKVVVTDSQGTQIQGSPSTLVIVPARATSVVVDVPDTLNINNTATVTIDLSDPWGNPSIGGDRVECSLVSAQTSTIVNTAPTYSGTPGKYTATFKVPEGGVFQARASVNNDVLVQKNIKVYSLFGGTCTTFTAAINQGQVWTLDCTAFDVYGFPRITGGDTVVATASGGNLVVTDKGNGQYYLAYSCDSISQQTITVTINEKAVQNSPMAVTIMPGSGALAGIIIGFLVFFVVVAALTVYFVRRRQFYAHLEKQRRRPAQVFKPKDEDEWSGDEGDPEVDIHEEWFVKNADVNRAHDVAVSQLRDTDDITPLKSQKSLRL